LLGFSVCRKITRQEYEMAQGRSDPTRERLDQVLRSFERSARAVLETGEKAGSRIVEAGGVLVASLRSGGRILTFGNGGSAADAQHFAAELAGRFERERPGLPALALSANSSDITAIGNDYGFDRSFSRLIEAHGVRGDMAIAISTSGNSPNILTAVEAARERGLVSVGLVGKGGGKLAPAVDHAIIVPSDVTPRIQESHIAIGHIVCELVEADLFPELESS
jgi:D-sedoheptulose 7-phosphate isomerase